MTKQRKKRRVSNGSFRNSKKPLLEILREIRKGRRFLVATHENPDGDGLASSLALARGLRQLGKKVKVYSRDPVPVSLRFLPGWESISSRLLSGERFDVSFLVDCAVPSRVGSEFERHPGLGKKIVLDHHAESGCGRDTHIIDTRAASAGMVVYRVLRGMGVCIDRSIATNIYCTIASDTGNFSYSNTSAEVLQLAADLVGMGVCPWEVSRGLQESYPRTRLSLLELVLKTIEFQAGGKIGSIVLTQNMLRKTGATSDLAEDFVNFPRSIKSVEVAILIREVGKKEYRISLRSKEVVDVGCVAAGFDGGGHLRAAGFTMTGTLSHVKKTLYRALKRELE